MSGRESDSRSKTDPSQVSGFLMEKRCPYCGSSVREGWHRRYGIQKLDKGLVEAGIPVVGRVTLHRETLVMVYVCELTNLPFLVSLVKAR